MRAVASASGANAGAERSRPIMLLGGAVPRARRQVGPGSSRYIDDIGAAARSGAASRDDGAGLPPDEQLLDGGDDGANGLAAV